MILYDILRQLLVGRCYLKCNMKFKLKILRKMMFKLNLIGKKIK